MLLLAITIYLLLNNTEVHPSCQIFFPLGLVVFGSSLDKFSSEQYFLLNAAE
jgi:hypothetical protein